MNRTVFTKSLAAASATNIALSQSPGANALLLNGAASNYLSTTTTAAALAGSVVLHLTSVTGVAVGQSVTDSTTACIPSGTVVTGVDPVGLTVTLSKPLGGASGAGTATIDTVSANNSAIGRRVILTSGGNDSGITFTVKGTNSFGNAITDIVTGANIGAAQSNLDFVTVTSIVPSGAIAGTITAGTNGVGSSPWYTWNWRVNPPFNLGMAVELVSGAVNFTVQHTYDDPNNLLAGALFPQPFNSTAINAAAATIDGAYTTPIIATRLLINSGTGVVRARFEQVGVG